MDISMQKMMILGFLGVSVAGISAWLHIKGKDGSGWGFMAFCLLLSSCSMA